VHAGSSPSSLAAGPARRIGYTAHARVYWKLEEDEEVVEEKVRKMNLQSCQ
jgi:hypothetical protein